MKILIAADHAGFALKGTLIDYLRTLGYDAEDLGAHELNPDDDYPDFMTPLAKRVADEFGSRGILVGGSGQGEAMCANRIPGIRAAVFYGGSLELVRLAREHNDANILSLGARFVAEHEAEEAVRTFLETTFSDSPRHARRLAKF